VMVLQLLCSRKAGRLDKPPPDPSRVPMPFF
jgi:hypothetical protein